MGRAGDGTPCFAVKGHIRLDLLILTLAGFGAGVLNTLAGGGTLLTLPALIFTGVSLVAAIATSAVAVFSRYAGEAIAFLPEMLGLKRALLVHLALVTVAGSLLLNVSLYVAFSVIVPFLLLGATLTLLFVARLRAFAAIRAKEVTLYGSTWLSRVAVYGDYFDCGLGIVLTALFALKGIADFNRMNGLKSMPSFELSAVSMPVFAVAGLIEWVPAFAIMLVSTAEIRKRSPCAKGTDVDRPTCHRCRRSFDECCLLCSSILDGLAPPRGPVQASNRLCCWCQA